MDYKDYHAQNINEDAFNYSSYSGAEMKAYFVFMVPKIDENGNIKYDNNGDIELGGKKYIELGTLSGISGVTNSQIQPAYVMGQANARGTGKGKRITGGTLTFEVIRKDLASIIINNINKEDGSDGTERKSVTISDVNGNIFNISKGNFLDRLPPFDIMCIHKDESNENISSKEVIKAVNITSEGSAIGLDSLIVQEQMEYTAYGKIPMKTINRGRTAQGGAS